MKIVIIGCGAAGGTAAQFARKVNRKAEIILYDKEGYGQYSKCALPLVISGKDWKEIIEFSPNWFKRNGIDYRNEEVYRIDDGRIEAEKEEDFDKLIIATGSIAMCPFTAENVCFLRNIEDAVAIRKKALKSRKAIVVGAGLIGLEVAEALNKMGLEVKLIEYMPYILPNMLTKDVAEYVMNFIKNFKLDIILNCKVEKIEENIVYTDKGEYKADFVVVAVGNKPNDYLYPNMEVNEKCMVKENIYAAGDCTIIKDFFGRKIKAGLGSIAVRQGKVAGINAAGGNEVLFPPLLSKVTKIFGLEIASTGISKECIEAKYIGNDLPHYMNGEQILVKIISNEEGKILGCQAVGRGAAKIVDRIALAIYNKMNVRDIARIENAYCPAVAPVFDAVEICCQIIEKKLKSKL